MFYVPALAVYKPDNLQFLLNKISTAHVKLTAKCYISAWMLNITHKIMLKSKVKQLLQNILGFDNFLFYFFP